MIRSSEAGHAARTRRRKTKLLVVPIALLGLLLTASAAFGGFGNLAKAVRDHVYCKVARDCVYDAPETKIVDGPKGWTDDSRPSFRFDSDERHVSYACGLDGKALKPCDNPFRSPELRDGKHVLEVAATDKDGWTDPTPASREFVVDTRAPDCSVADGKRRTRDRTPSFGLRSSDGKAKFQYRVDRGGYHRTGKKLRLKKLRPGKHTLFVRAVDRAGNVDRSPDRFGFRVVGGNRGTHGGKH